MALPFNVSCTHTNPVLYELPDDRFRVMTAGSVGPWVAGFQFLLVEARLAEFLMSLGIERVTYRKATIIEPRTAEERRTHTRIVVQQFFRGRDLPDIPIEGLRILTLADEYYFVSPALKAELEKAGFEYLRFSEGPSGSQDATLPEFGRPHRRGQAGAPAAAATERLGVQALRKPLCRVDPATPGSS